MEENQNLCYTDKIKETVCKELEQFNEQELNEENLDSLYKLVDIYKDLENIDYWNCKKEVMGMRYSNYGDYSEGRYSEGRYGNYGRRGVPGSGRGRYRGHDEGEDMLEDMKYSYGAYSESRNYRGNYGAEQDGMKALEDTMQLFTEFAQKMIQETDSPEAKQIIKKHLRKIAQMSEM